MEPKEFYDEDLKFRYQNNQPEYSASIYGLPYQEFPVTAFTNEATYQQWCIQVAGMMYLCAAEINSNSLWLNA